ncbi:MAG TPA: phosphoribosylglycinamide synthetase C domain-containing protein, partial [Flavisolibacter sp.]|nr:phosphoribosylglycinamide synthetase C domain-containing protein [Flavisolibacter sp.]
IVAVSGGYPNDYEKGFQIRGLKAISDDALIFHSGTKEDNGKILTNGGRVICATALADTLDAAINEARELIDEISFEGKYYRRDIGYEFVKDFTE